MDRYSLPHGAKGFKGEGFAIVFAADKVVLIAKPRVDGQPDEPRTEMHHTFHAGPDSGVVDLHETTTAADGQKDHRTLFALRADDLPPVLQQLAPMLGDLLSLVRPLRVGWMARCGIGIARGVDPLNDLDFIPEYLDEVYEFPDGQFTLFHGRRKIGFGFKATDASGNIRLFWIKRRDLLRFGNHWQPKVIDVFRSAAIPPEHYPRYLFLCS